MLNKQGILKIIDFGLAKTLQEGDVKESKVSGTARFIAAEQLLELP